MSINKKTVTVRHVRGAYPVHDHDNDDDDDDDVYQLFCSSDKTHDTVKFPSRQGGLEGLSQTTHTTIDAASRKLVRTTCPKGVVLSRSHYYGA